MKITAWLALFALLLVGPVLSQEDQTLPSKPPASVPVVPAPTPRPKPKKEPAKKAEPAPVIEGIAIPRGTGFLGIAIVNSTFRLSFYDAEKKPVTPDVPRAALRWPVKYQPGDERAVLAIGPDGKSLTSARVIRAPYTFKLFITLIGENAPEGAGETYVVDFKG